VFSPDRSGEITIKQIAGGSPTQAGLNLLSMPFPPNLTIQNRQKPGRFLMQNKNPIHFLFEPNRKRPLTKILGMRLINILILIMGLCLIFGLVPPPAVARPELAVQMVSAMPQKFSTPYGYGVHVKYSLENDDATLYHIEAYQVQVDEGDGVWRTTHANRPAAYDWANIHGSENCCPDRYNLPSGASVKVRVRARYHPTSGNIVLTRDEDLPSRWTDWSAPIEARVASWNCSPPDATGAFGPYFHNIYAWDYSPIQTGLKLLVDIPPEPDWRAVEEYVIMEGDRQVGVIPANRSGELTFAEIDDYPLDYAGTYTYTIFARWTEYADDASCTPHVVERQVFNIDPDTGSDVPETLSRRTRYADGIDAVAAALRHRPLMVFDASEIYWPVSVEWILDKAAAAGFHWEGGPKLQPGLAAGTYSEEDLMAFSHRQEGVDFLTWNDFHRDGETDGGVLLDYAEYAHPQNRHTVDSNNAGHNMGFSPAAREGLSGCADLYGTAEEWYYDCHRSHDDGRDLWDLDRELSQYYRAPHPQWKLYYTVYPYGDGEYQIVYQLWHAWDAVWEDGDSLGVGATEFVTKHEGDQTTFRIFTGNHGKTAHTLIGGMHGMPVYARGQKGPLPQPQEFKFYGRPASGYNVFLYDEDRNPYQPDAYQSPAETFRPLAYWNFLHDNPAATHPVLFVSARSHGTSPIPGVLKETLPDVFSILGNGVDAYLRDAFTGTGMRWFPTVDQMVPIEMEHPAFFHYIGWTGNWDYQDRRGPNPGWQQALTPPHSPHAILRPWGGLDNFDTPQDTEKIIEWAGDTTRHGPEGPYKWSSAVLNNGWFENMLDTWKTYGDGIKAVAVGTVHDGHYGAYIQRAAATGRYFGFYQQDIRVEPGTEYQLSVWVKTVAVGGTVAAALGVWSSDPARNHHTDFGYVGGAGDWVKISGRWTSRPDETRLQVCLFGRPDFRGEAYFDGLVLQKVIPSFF
jgi:hypothetical protein